MQLSSGKILRSTSLMDDPFFVGSSIFIVEYNEKGALGFVVNEMFERLLNELVEFQHSPAFPLYTGGPVDSEHLYFIHRRNDLITGGTPVVEDVYFGGDFAQAIFWMNEGRLTAKEIKIFIGYCGWDNNDLEMEVADESWQLTAYQADSIFGL